MTYPLWKVICLLSDWFVISVQAAKKSTLWLPDIVREYIWRHIYKFDISLSTVVRITLAEDTYVIFRGPLLYAQREY